MSSYVLARVPGQFCDKRTARACYHQPLLLLRHHFPAMASVTFSDRQDQDAEDDLSSPNRQLASPPTTAPETEIHSPVLAKQKRFRFLEYYDIFYCALFVALMLTFCSGDRRICVWKKLSRPFQRSFPRSL